MNIILVYNLCREKIKIKLKKNDLLHLQYRINTKIII